jgi:hypothetical protein
MKRLLPNQVPITSNYEEITFWEETIKISNDDTITGENLLALKTNGVGFRQWGEQNCYI